MSELTPAQLDAVDTLIAQHIGQWSSEPEKALEALVKTWPSKSKEAARERLAENVFYCVTCGNYCDIGERHAGDFCDECCDEKEAGE